MDLDMAGMFGSLADALGGEDADADADPDAPAADEAEDAPLGAMVFRPTFRKRNACRFATVRAWRTSSKRADLDAMQEAKRAPIISANLIEFMALEMADVVAGLFGPLPWTVTAVATGHSRRPDALARQVAELVALQLSRPFRLAFEDRYISGSSHPRQHARLAPLVLTQPRIAGPVLVVDDIVTSGWHMEEAARDLRAIGCATFGIAWLGGSVTGE
jgi:hypothetical protein